IATPVTRVSTLSLHDALPISGPGSGARQIALRAAGPGRHPRGRGRLRGQANLQFHRRTSFLRHIMGITLTQQAAEHIQRHLAKRGKGLGLRLGVKPSGCSGMSYHLEYVDDPVAEDQVFEQFGARVYVAPDSLPYLQGMELDYA